MDADLIRARAEELGADVQIRHAALERLHDCVVDGSCPIHLGQGDGLTTVRRPGFRSEGSIVRQVALAGDDRDAPRLDAFLREVARLQARERAVAGHPTPNSPYPAWSFTVDALALRIAAMDGIDLSPCSLPVKWRRTEEVLYGRRASATDAWEWSRETHAVRGAEHPDAKPGSGRSVKAETKAGRLVLRVYTPRALLATLREEPGGTRLILHKLLPESVMSAVRGRPLGEVVEGLGDTHRVVSATERAGWTQLTVKGPRVALAPAPEGVDTSWLGLEPQE